MDRITEQSILSAVWILSCTDKIPQMTYVGIKKRIVIPNEIDLQKLVASKTELFRIGIPSKQLADWKEDMKTKSSRPTWIASSKNQEEAINNIKKGNVFRNRFRNSLKAQPVPIEILQWGLNHIDQMYDLEKEDKERNVKLITTVLIPILSLLLAFSSIYFSSKSNTVQQSLKKYELSLKPKQEGYTEFMVALYDTYFASMELNKQNTLDGINSMNNAYYKIQPFMEEKIAEEIWEKYQEFTRVCLENVQSDSIVLNVNPYIEKREYFQEELSKQLLYKE